MTDLTNSTFGVFDTVIGGPAAVPYEVGWVLLGAGTLWSLLVAQVKTMAGERGNPIGVVVNTGVLAAGLGLYSFICRAVWWGTQSIARAIFPDSRLQALGKALKDIATSHREATSSGVLNVAQSIKDTMVDFAGMMSWVTAIMSHWQIQNIQAGVYNVVFIFGPLLIGLAAFGLPSARVWLMALFEVSSWSISAAVLYFGLQSQFERYLDESTTANLLDTKFLNVMSNLFFLSMMMIIVPVITGRLLGSATLGELARVQPGNSFMDRLAERVRNKTAGYSAAPDPASGARGGASQSSSSQQHKDASRRRPGD